VAAILIALLFLGGAAFAQVPVQLPPAATDHVSAKIRFDLSVFDQSGLYGPPDGLRAAAYEFCIPASEYAAGVVKAVDPTIQIYPASPGRIGCGSDQLLCIGSTHQPEFRDVLRRLAELDFVRRIELSFAE
jgi:hypothetical protein